MESIPMISTLIGISGVIYAFILAIIVRTSPDGDEKMREIAEAIREGAIAYLNRQFLSMSVTGFFIFLIIYFTHCNTNNSNKFTT